MGVFGIILKGAKGEAYWRPSLPREVLAIPFPFIPSAPAPLRVHLVHVATCSLCCVAAVLMQVLQIHTASVKVGGVPAAHREKWDVCELSAQTAPDAKLLLRATSAKLGVCTSSYLGHLLSQPGERSRTSSMTCTSLRGARCYALL